ncbi:hypothetical protein BFS30_24670 [Pedobacter steynii]|uniref:Uncharacterized protein n=1 Tax=Pedobacter steynii TaxID=430522 RepID=A0A1D7QN48_9SPHI|nr:hypothetical protein BFS30_24670 [Pedobacter steynii]
MYKNDKTMLFRKRKRSPDHTPIQDRAALGIANGIIRLQSRMAAKLSRWESKCTVRQKKILLFVFCLVFGTYCLFLLLRSILL